MPRLEYTVGINGSSAVVNAFKGIADAATTAQRQTERATRNTTTSTKALSAAMAELERSASASLGSLGSVGNVLGAISKTGAVGAAIAGLGALTAGLTGAALVAIDVADNLQDSADSAGVSAEKFQELRFALAGVGVDEAKLTGFLQRFTKNLGDLQTRGTGPLQKALKDTDKALLESVRSAPTVDAALDLILSRLIELPAAQQKASLAAAAFGKGAGALTPILTDNADGLRALTERAQETGNVIDASLLGPASQASDRLAQLSQTIKSNLTAALIEVAPEIEAVANKLIDLVGAAGRLATGRQKGERYVNEDVSALTEDIARAERTLERTRPGSPAADETLAQVEALNKKRDALLGVAEAERQVKQQDQQAAQFVGPPEPTDAEQRAAERNADKAQRDLDRAEEILRRARNETALGATDGAAKIREAARQEIEEKSAELRKLIPDQQRAEDAVQEYRVTRTKQADDEIAKYEAGEAEKKAKREAAAQRSARRELLTLDRELAGRNGDTEAGIWERARLAFDDYAERVREGVQDQATAAKLIADYWVKHEQLAQAEITELREKNADDAAKAAERAAKESAKATEGVFRELETTVSRTASGIGDALIGSLLGFEDQARSTTDVVSGLFEGILGDLGQGLVDQGIKGAARPVLEAVGGLFGQDVDLSSLAQKAEGLAKDAAAAQAAATAAKNANAANAAELAKTAEGLATSATEAQGALDTATSGLAKFAGALIGTIGALVAAGISIAEGGNEVRDASYGQNGPANASMIASGIGVAAFTAGGAAIGAAFGGIGAPIGAAVGAAVGTAITRALQDTLASEIRDGVSEGLDQASLDKQVTNKLLDDTLLNILSLGANQIIAPVLTPLFTPDIERIFEKILRQALGGTGGFNTTGIPVDPRGYSGLRELAPTAGQAGRIIATAFGAGGAAYGDEREGRFARVLLAATKRRTTETGQDATRVLAEAFVAAFEADFIAALRAASKTGKRRRAGDLTFAAGQFGLATSGQIDYQPLAALAEAQGSAPGTKAVKASREAFSAAFSAALADGANSSAFRRSLASSVEQAFIEKAGTALDKAFGSVFAQFFALSREARRDFRQARRSGQFGEAVGILSDDFAQRTDEFAAVVSQPGFADAITRLGDSLLKLQVATALAAGSTREAADAIEARLAPQIQVVRDLAQLDRDLRSRSRLAIAGPGIAQDAESVALLRTEREEAQRRFEARIGRIGVDAAGNPFSSRLVDGTTRIEALEPGEATAALREFADARLAELEAEIALARQLRDLFRGLEDQFRTIEATAANALGTFDPRAEQGRLRGEVDTTRAAAFAERLPDGTLDPDKWAAFATALSAAVGAAVERLNFLADAVRAFGGIARGIDETLRGLSAAPARLATLRADIARTFPTAIGGGAGSVQATGNLRDQLTEAVGLASNQRSFFEGSAEGFRGLADQAAVASRGKRAQRQQLAARQAELQALLPLALGGDAEALRRAQTLSSDVLSLGSQVGGTRGRRAARDVEATSTQLAKVAQAQADLATRQLTELQKIAKDAEAAFTAQQTIAAQQLEALQAIAADAKAEAGTAAADANAKLGTLVTDLQAFVAEWQPVIGYLQDAAATTLHADLARIEEALGTDGALAGVFRDVRARLPETTTRATNAVLAPATAPAPTQPVTIGTVQVTFQQPPTSQAEAREYGRQIGDALLERVQQYQQRTTLRKVA
jgi:hypothetical protein